MTHQCDICFRTEANKSNFPIECLTEQPQENSPFGYGDWVKHKKSGWVGKIIYSFFKSHTAFCNMRLEDGRIIHSIHHSELEQIPDQEG